MKTAGWFTPRRPYRGTTPSWSRAHCIGMVHLCRFSMLSLMICTSIGCTSFQFAGSEDRSAPSHLVGRKGMVEMSSGTFKMGAHQGEPDEFPVHDVEITGFWIDMTEVRTADYAICVKKKVCREVSGNIEAHLKGPQQPVVGVTWRDAKKYCKWVGKRLPTEAEWEYAARSPIFSRFPWKGGFDAKKANTRGDADGAKWTSPVGTYTAGQTDYGLLDMAGNVAEWTADWYESTYYRNSPPKDPKGPSLNTGARVVRGGSWADNEYGVRTTSRNALDPRLGNNTVGFRCVARQP